MRNLDHWVGAGNAVKYTRLSTPGSSGFARRDDVKVSDAGCMLIGDRGRTTCSWITTGRWNSKGVSRLTQLGRVFSGRDNG